MEQTPKQEQAKEQQNERRRKNIGTPLTEMFEELRKQKKSRFIEGCNETEHDDDDVDCFCD